LIRSCQPYRPKRKWGDGGVNIRISSIRIHVISNLGSLNIGKTILSRNTVQREQGTPSASAESNESDNPSASDDPNASGDPKAGGSGDAPRVCG